MKKYLLALTVFLSFVNAKSQRLTLNDLTNLCNKKNWEDINQTLLNKEWSYFDSNKGSTFEYNTIAWTFNKENYSDEAQGWFYLFTYESLPNKILYTVANKESYQLVQNTLSSNGFKLMKSEIEDKRVTSTYSNQSYILIITTEKRESSDWSNRSVTAYNITLIKKSGVYDPYNGTKKEYYDDGSTIKLEYNLKNSALNGSFKRYYSDGTIMKSGNFVNGKESGLFKEYNEKGNIDMEYNMKDSLMHGLFKTYYDNGQIKKIGNYLNDKQNGTFKEFSENGDLIVTYNKTNDEYNGLLIVYEKGKISKKINYSNGIRNGMYQELSYGVNDSLLLESVGVYKNGLKDGIWNLFLYRKGNKKSELAEYTTYKNEVKEGAFKKTQGDSLIFGNYINDKLDGNYIVYTDILKTLFGGIIRTDSTKLRLLSKGQYYKDKKTGDWVYFSFGSKIREGHFLNDFKDGEWKYYYPNYVDDKGLHTNYSGTLFLIQNYDTDKLNGKSIRYSYINKEKVLCDSSLNKDANPIDTCNKSTWIKIFESCFYRNDLLHGPYIFKDSIGTIRFQGNYLNGKKDGIWLEGYINKGINDEKYIVYEEGAYINDKREGKWKEFVNRDNIWSEYFYNSDKLNGKYISYNKNKNIKEIKTFENDILKTLSVFDSLGKNIVSKYDIVKETDIFLNVRKTDYYNDSIISLMYYMKKDEPKLNHNFFELIFLLKSGKYSNGLDCYPDGELTLSDNKNQIVYTGSLEKTNKTGLWKYYYPKQNIEIHIEYLNNENNFEKYYLLNSNKLFSGIFIYHDKTNGIKEERKIIKGLRNGRTNYINISTNKVIKKEKYKDGKLS